MGSGLFFGAATGAALGLLVPVIWLLQPGVTSEGDGSFWLMPAFAAAYGALLGSVGGVVAGILLWAADGLARGKVSFHRRTRVYRVLISLATAVAASSQSSGLIELPFIMGLAGAAIAAGFTSLYFHRIAKRHEESAQRNAARQQSR